MAWSSIHFDSHTKNNYRCIVHTQSTKNFSRKPRYFSILRSNISKSNAMEEKSMQDIYDIDTMNSFSIFALFSQIEDPSSFEEAVNDDISVLHCE